MVTDRRFSYLQQLSDQELDSLAERARDRSFESWRTTAAGLYLVFAALVLPAMVLIRAAERSSWFEITLWSVLAVGAVFAWAEDRRRKTEKSLYEACVQERDRRGA